MLATEINKERTLSAILGSGIPPLAAEEAALLVEKWIEAWVEEDSKNWRIEAVEMPFYLWLDKEKTALGIGVSDLRMFDVAAGRRAHGEWKSAGEPKPRSRYNEETWAEELNNGHQIAFYALAQMEGHFLLKEAVTALELGDAVNVKTDLFLDSAEEEPAMYVRACVKSNPPRFWPSDGAVFSNTFTREELQAVKRAFLSEARAIQARRREGVLPWMLVGHQCKNAFGRMCEFHLDCLAHKYPEFERERVFSSDDPGSEVLRWVRMVDPKPFENPELVVLSASAYSNSQQCAELYRERNLCAQGKEESFALDTGTGMHAGVADVYRQMREWQRGQS